VVAGREGDDGHGVLLLAYSISMAAWHKSGSPGSGSAQKQARLQPPKSVGFSGDYEAAGRIGREMDRETSDLEEIDGSFISYCSLNRFRCGKHGWQMEARNTEMLGSGELFEKLDKLYRITDVDGSEFWCAA
jgi:hypothetical protein